MSLLEKNYLKVILVPLKSINKELHTSNQKKSTPSRSGNRWSSDACCMDLYNYFIQHQFIFFSDLAMPDVAIMIVSE